jgi:16S rRNA (cytosine967-C5)-methyltransferase
LDSGKFKVSAARRAAFDVLRRVESEGAYAGNLLTSNRYQDLPREDHALAQEITLGVLRWQGQLDYLIEHYARRNLNKLDREVIIALRIGLYQLRNLSRIPPHAAINESVNLVKEEKKSSAAPLVNAVLRAAQRDSRVDFPSKDSLAGLAIETSHPPWLIERWVDRFGEDETRALALSNNQAPRTAFRFNPYREEMTRAWLAEHGIKTRNSDLTPGAMSAEFGIRNSELSSNGSSDKTNSAFRIPHSAFIEAVQEGWIYLQDEASQLVAHLIADLEERAEERGSGGVGEWESGRVGERESGRAGSGGVGERAGG